MTGLAELDEAVEEVEVEPEEFLEEEKKDFVDYLKARSPNKSLGDYANHPLNFNGSEGLSQVLRGLEGIFDSLDFALIDVGVGVIRLVRENMPEEKTSKKEMRGIGSMEETDLDLQEGEID